MLPCCKKLKMLQSCSNVALYHLVSFLPLRVTFKVTLIFCYIFLKCSIEAYLCGFWAPLKIKLRKLSETKLTKVRPTMAKCRSINQQLDLQLDIQKLMKIPHTKDLFWQLSANLQGAFCCIFIYLVVLFFI